MVSRAGIAKSSTVASVTWQLVLASGGPRERGRAYGEQAATRIGRSLAIYEEIFAHYAQLPWAEVRGRGGAFVEAIDGYDVQLLPELEGIAEGAGVDPEDVLAMNLRTEIMFGLDARPSHAAMKECTAIGCASAPAGGSVLVAQNWDWKPAVRETCVLLVCAPHDRPGFVSLVEAGLWAKCGMNEAGVGLTTNALQSSRDKGEPGVPYHAILRRILTSPTFEEAVAAVTQARRASSANYLLGHRDGRAVNLEVAPGGADDVCATEGPALAHTNHFLWPEPRPFKDVGRIDGEDSLVRLAGAQTAIAAGTASLPEVQEALRSHADAPDSVCVHEDPTLAPVEDYATIGSMVADLAAGTLWVTQGNPCVAAYEPVEVAATVARARARASAAG